MGDWEETVGVAPTLSLFGNPVLCLGPTDPELSQTSSEDGNEAFQLVIGLFSECGVTP